MTTVADDRAVAEDLLHEAVSDALGDAAARVEHQVTVSQYVLHNAPCPVLTVPEADIDSSPTA